VTNALDSSGLASEQLKLEITESVILDESEKTAETIHRLHDLGVSFAIDDFGTGYSSLSSLRQYPFETLKIDRSFVAGVTTSSDAANLVRSIVAIARSMNLAVVAEGVETADQRQFVTTAGCDMVQGWFHGKAVPADRFADLLRASDRDGVGPMTTAGGPPPSAQPPAAAKWQAPAKRPASPTR